MPETEVRTFEVADVPEVLRLMKELAEFEGYASDFKVDEGALIDNGFGATARFGVFVAERKGGIIGIAVHYVIPWTFDLRPTVVLKELFVSAGSRSLGAGRLLFQAVVEYACRIGAPRLTWHVLPDNEPAIRFYSSLGGSPDTSWQTWKLDLGAQASSGARRGAP